MLIAGVEMIEFQKKIYHNLYKKFKRNSRKSVQLTSFKDIRYVCLCGKRQDPPSDSYLAPYSCGEPCGKALDKDIAANASYDDDYDDHYRHRCVVQCHPSPCPSCKAFASPKMCPCGK
uniref:NF-X1-type zinc finger protein NFXL1 n=1 Tax=Tanacetum cinerariifolium TaxID=118510 RepID=A0A699IQ75_TANCI|nr:NF-X1-type zinc finger protein NFXL1 [Tanacetum cinerariifolium]